MAITPADFKIRFEEFESVPDSKIQFWLNDALLEVGESAWSELYEKGVFLLAAHLLSLDLSNQDEDESGGATGNVTSRSVGDVSVSFAKATSDSSSDDWYLQTSYGTEYLRLKKRMGMGIVAISPLMV
jgi:hypothetical protein